MPGWRLVRAPSGDSGPRVSLCRQVISGGHYDVDCYVQDPLGNTIYRETKKQYDSFTYQAEVKGVYQFCFSNEFSTFSHKTVYFDFQVGDEPPILPEMGSRVTALTQVSGHTQRQSRRHPSGRPSSPAPVLASEQSRRPPSSQSVVCWLCPPFRTWSERTLSSPGLPLLSLTGALPGVRWCPRVPSRSPSQRRLPSAHSRGPSASLTRLRRGDQGPLCVACRLG